MTRIVKQIRMKGLRQMIRIRIDGEPIPAARPRFSGRRAYQPKRNVEYRKQVQAAALVAMNGAEPLKGEVVATVKLFRKYKPTARNFGDVDNHLKALFDGMNQIVFADDAQIVRCLVEKFKDADNPRAEIEIISRWFAFRGEKNRYEKIKAVIFLF